MTVRRSDDGDRALAEWWEEAYSQDYLTRNTFFQSPVWCRTWREHYVDPDPRRESVLLRVEDEGRIVAAVPLFLQRRDAGPLTAWRYLLWIGDGLAQYPDMVTTAGDTAAVWRAVRAYLASEFRGAWLLLRDVLPDSTVASASEGAVSRKGETYLRLDLRGGDETTYVAGCVPHMRKEIHRARRLLARTDGPRWRAERAPDEDAVQRLIDLNRTRFGTASWFADERNAVFFRTLCARAGGEVLLTTVEASGVPVHMMASYLHGGTVHYVLSGFDTAAKALGPGTLNIDRSIAWAMREGFRYFDFLRGDEDYKREFNPEERTSVDLEWSFPGSGARRKLARAAQRLRRKPEEER